MAGTSWPSLTAGQPARASDVESKFDWLEGSLMPMSAGTGTDGAHDLGTTTARWARLHLSSRAFIGTTTVGTTTGQANPGIVSIGNNDLDVLSLQGNASQTSIQIYHNASSRIRSQLNFRQFGTDSGTTLYVFADNTLATLRQIAAFSGQTENVVIGNTGSADASSLLEIAGSRAVLLPRLTTGQRDLLTAVNGMILYNSTAAQFQARENGSWVGMVGARIGPVAKVRSFTQAAATQTALAVTASGRLISILSNLAAAASGSTVYVQDSVTTSWSGGATGTTAARYLVYDIGDTTGAFSQTTTSTRIDLFFREQLVVYTQGDGLAGTTAVNIIYERTG